MTTIIEIQERGLKVRMNNQVTLIAKYEDANGVYFYNENLEKQYVADTQKEINKVEKIEVVEVEKEEVKNYIFEVEYEHNGRANGFALTTTTVKAKSREQAIEKVYNNFKTIFEISEL